MSDAEEFVEAIPQGGDSTEGEPRATMQQMLQILKVGIWILAGGIVVGQVWIGLPADTALLQQDIKVLEVRTTALEHGQREVNEKLDRLTCMLGMSEEERVRLSANIFALDRACGL